MHPPRAKPFTHRQHRWRTAWMRLLLPTASLPGVLLTGAGLVLPETPEISEVAIDKSFTNDSEVAPEDGETRPSTEEIVSPNDEAAVVYTILVEPPAQGRAHKAAYTLIPQHPLPEGVTLPTLVVRTLGEPAAPSHE